MKNPTPEHNRIAQAMRKWANLLFGDDLPELPSFLSNTMVIIGVLLCSREIYVFINYVFAINRYLPDFLRSYQNHLNALVFLLAIWLILFFHFLQRGNFKGLLMLSLIYGGLLLHFWYGKSQQGWSSVYFYIPSGIPRILFYIDTLLFLWIVLRVVWIEDEGNEPDPEI